MKCPQCGKEMELTDGDDGGIVIDYYKCECGCIEQISVKSD